MRVGFLPRKELALRNKLTQRVHNLHQYKCFTVIIIEKQL